MLDVDRTMGALTMQALGDALGAPVEGLKPGHLQQLLGGPLTGFVDPAILWKAKPHRWRLTGLHTDDTQQALIVADTLLDQAGWDADAVARRYVAFAQPVEGLPYGVHRGTGAFFRQCVRRMEQGVAPLLCGAPSAGPGAAMRVAPIALWHAEEEDALIDATLECSLMTHHDGRGVLCAVAVALAVARLARAPMGADFDPLAVAEAVRQGVEEAEARLDALARQTGVTLTPLARPARHITESLAGLVRESADDLARQSILSEAARQGPDHPIRSTSQPFAPALVPWAIYTALTARSPVDGLLNIVNAGYDADTAGAIAGALLGARFGLGAAPPEWRQTLAAADVVRLCGEALALKRKDETLWQDLYAWEKEWSRREWQERETLMRAASEASDRRAARRAAQGKAPAKKKGRKPAGAKGTGPERETPPDALDTPEQRRQQRQEREKQQKARDRERADRRKQSRRAAFMTRGDLGLYGFDLADEDDPDADRPDTSPNRRKRRKR